MTGINAYDLAEKNLKVTYGLKWIIELYSKSMDFRKLAEAFDERNPITLSDTEEATEIPSAESLVGQQCGCPLEDCPDCGTKVEACLIEDHLTICLSHSRSCPCSKVGCDCKSTYKALGSSRIHVIPCMRKNSTNPHILDRYKCPQCHLSMALVEKRNHTCLQDEDVSCPNGQYGCPYNAGGYQIISNTLRALQLERSSRFYRFNNDLLNIILDLCKLRRSEMIDHLSHCTPKYLNAGVVWMRSQAKCNYCGTEYKNIAWDIKNWWQHDAVDAFDDYTHVCTKKLFCPNYYDVCGFSTDSKAKLEYHAEECVKALCPFCNKLFAKKDYPTHKCCDAALVMYMTGDKPSFPSGFKVGTAKRKRYVEGNPASKYPSDPRVESRSQTRDTNYKVRYLDVVTESEGYFSGYTRLLG